MGISGALGPAATIARASGRTARRRPAAMRHAVTAVTALALASLLLPPATAQPRGGPLAYPYTGTLKPLRTMR